MIGKWERGYEYDHSRELWFEDDCFAEVHPAKGGWIATVWQDGEPIEKVHPTKADAMRWGRKFANIEGVEMDEPHSHVLDYYHHKIDITWGIER